MKKLLDDKKFYKFVIPSIGAMLVTGLYFVVDGIFVGRGVGTAGLAAVNIAVPFISLLTAFTMMIAMGGGTLASIEFGRNNYKKANEYFNLSLVIVILFALFMTFVSLIFPIQVARFLGASKVLENEVAVYLKYYVIFGIFFCGSSILSVFVRNDNNPELALWGMLVGALTNIFLDWLLVFPLKMGLKGAAIASGLGQILACLVLFSHFLGSEKKLKISFTIFDRDSIFEIIKIGRPEFITQMSQPVTILCYNYLAMKIFGDMGVAAFSVISYILVIVICIFTGLGQGIQPLISHSVGENKKEKANYFFKKGIKLNILLSIFMYVTMLVFGKKIISVFNPNVVLVDMAYRCINVYGISFIFASVNIVFIIYYLATKNTNHALIISGLRSFILNVLFIFCIPIMLGKNFIWSGMIVAELSVMLVAIFV
ncbi:MATE family efflux transporter [Fusobacterium sp. MFO224]|uniref:MATE family efflux transporter n=1 Tax=Fusobacterium sp. MFO224 TaxID=3378070 RepID=UPI003855168E